MAAVPAFVVDCLPATSSCYRNFLMMSAHAPRSGFRVVGSLTAAAWSWRLRHWSPLEVEIGIHWCHDLGVHLGRSPWPYSGFFRVPLHDCLHVHLVLMDSVKLVGAHCPSHRWWMDSLIGLLRWEMHQRLREWGIETQTWSSFVAQVPQPSSLQAEPGSVDADARHLVVLRLVRHAEKHFPCLGCQHPADRSHQTLSQKHQKKELEVDPCSCWEVRTDCVDVMQAA